MFQESFKGVSRRFQGCFKEVSGDSRVFQGGSFKMFQESLKDVSRKFQVSRVF